ncbi:MAG: hypothetical protein Tsb0021_18490 [Chlamydiales bacterium]
MKITIETDDLNRDELRKIFKIIKKSNEDKDSDPDPDTIKQFLRERFSKEAEEFGNKIKSFYGKELVSTKTFKCADSGIKLKVELQVEPCCDYILVSGVEIDSRISHNLACEIGDVLMYGEQLYDHSVRAFVGEYLVMPDQEEATKWANEHWGLNLKYRDLIAEAEAEVKNYLINAKPAFDQYIDVEEFMNELMGV